MIYLVHSPQTVVCIYGKERAISEKRYRINESIRAREVRLVGTDGMVGVVPMRDALTMAREQGLDLVEVAPNADPPVCRMMDYGKFLYEKSKRERKARKAQKTIEVKEIRLRPKTGEHDVDFKVRDAERFLKHGYKVRIRVRFRGREITYPEIGRELLQDIAQRLSEVSEMESTPRMEGRSMLIVLSPSSKD
jgi:translation initiation factor IF-3